MNLLFGFTARTFHRHHNIELVGHRWVSVRRSTMHGHRHTARRSSLTHVGEKKLPCIDSFLNYGKQCTRDDQSIILNNLRHHQNGIGRAPTSDEGPGIEFRFGGRLTMLRNFDIIEKFSDGSMMWRACVFGKFEAERKLQELAEHSKNEFLAVDIQSGEPLPIVTPQKSRYPIKKAANG
jgi:hypothetical protein